MCLKYIFICTYIFIYNSTTDTHTDMQMLLKVPEFKPQAQRKSESKDVKLQHYRYKRFRMRREG